MDDSNNATNINYNRVYLLIQYVYFHIGIFVTQ